MFLSFCVLYDSFRFKKKIGFWGILGKEMIHFDKCMDEKVQKKANNCILEDLFGYAISGWEMKFENIFEIEISVMLVTTQLVEASLRELFSQLSLS